LHCAMEIVLGQQNFSGLKLVRSLGEGVYRYASGL
jgi:hypothetical protein